jgi:hypothetical protein
MNLRTLIFTRNACYMAGRTIAPKGVMVHSTGADNPSLKRYVGPDDGLLGHNQYGNHWNQYTPDGRQVCVHAFIGKLADGTVATYQTLPWDMRGWHCGSGAKGSANDTHIGFEICEDGLSDPAYFAAVYNEAVGLCAYLCARFALDPLADGVLICHSEGHKLGVASNHGDVTHWFPRFGKTMDGFRADVKAAMAPAPASAGTAIMGAPAATAEQMAIYLSLKNGAMEMPKAYDYAKLFVAEGEAEGVRGDVAFAQSCVETGNFKFGGDVKPEQNNFCGLGATGGGAAGCSFPTAREGIRAQIQHLKAYASTEPLKQPCVDPRFQHVTRGCAEFVEWLGQKENPNGKGWASGAGYGAKIVGVLKAIAATHMPGPEPGPDGVSDWAREAWQWGKGAGLCDGTRPRDPLTREEAITLFHRFKNLK